MKISPISFKGTYKIIREDISNFQMNKILSKKDKFDMSFITGSYLTGDNHFFIQTPDEKDDAAFKFLNKLKVPFTSLYKQDTLDSDNISSRIVLSKYDNTDNTILQKVRTSVLDEKFKEDKELYVAPNGINGTKTKYDRFKSYLETGEPILAPKIYFYGQKVRFYDGRHRFAVLRDLGMTKIPVAMEKKDIPIAKEIGLF